MSATPRSAIATDRAIAEMAGVVADVAHDLSPAGQAIVLAIGGFESGYGVPLTDWSNEQFVMEGDTPTYNWGACNATHGMPSLAGHDTIDGKPSTAHWAIFDTPHGGLGYFRKGFWDRYSGIYDAANAGDADQVAAIMYQHGYFGGTPTPNTELHSPEDDAGRIAAYAAAIKGWTGRVRRALEAHGLTLGNIPPTPESVYQTTGQRIASAATSPMGFGTVIVALALVGVGWWTFGARRS